MTETEKHSLAWFILSGVFDKGLKWRLSRAVEYEQSEVTKQVALGTSWIPKNQQQVYNALGL